MKHLIMEFGGKFSDVSMKSFDVKFCGDKLGPKSIQVSRYIFSDFSGNLDAFASTLVRWYGEGDVMPISGLVPYSAESDSIFMKYEVENSLRLIKRTE